jgi:MinD superfamily P-loop ATPase
VSERAARFVVAIGSGKGGVGKSTVSLHVALAWLLDVLEQHAAA